jgi:hypothetical protein
MEHSEVKVALMEQKVEDLKPVLLKIEAAIEKISEVNSSMSRIIAIHEERITKQEEIDTLLFTKIDKLRDKMDSDNDRVLSRLHQVEKKVWTAMGILTALYMLFNVENSNMLIKLFTPSAQEVIIE